MTDYTAEPVELVYDIDQKTDAAQVTALAGGGYVHVYQELIDLFDVPSPGAIHVQVYDDAEEKVGAEAIMSFPFRDDQTFTSVVALNSGGFIVNWEDTSTGNAVHKMQAYDASGVAVGAPRDTPHQIIGHTGDTYIGLENASPYASGQLFLGYYDQDFNLIQDVQIDDDSSHLQRFSRFATLENGNLLLTFSDFDANDKYLGSFAQQFDASGNKVGSEFQTQANDIIALKTGGYILSWESTLPGNKFEIHNQRYDALGNTVGNEVQMTVGSNGWTGTKMLSLEDGSYVIPWGEYSGAGRGFHIQRVDASGTKSGPEIIMPASQQWQFDLTALDNGAYIFGWTISDYVNNRSQAYQEIFTPHPSQPNQILGDEHDNLLDGSAVFGAEMHGLAGNDTYIVDDAADRALETDAGGADTGGIDTIKASVSHVLGDNVENLTLTGSDNIDGMGNGLANVIIGNAGDNHLDGGAGADIVTGGAGNDTYYVDNAGDKMNEAFGGGIDEARTTISLNISGLHIDNVTALGFGHVNLTGNGLDNNLSGNGGYNTLKGSFGNDTLNGGGGNDTLVGGAGHDSFVFASGSGKDRITDFSAVENDRIDINAYTHGVANGGGVVITQAGGDTLIDLGGGNTVLVTGALKADVMSHMAW